MLCSLSKEHVWEYFWAHFEQQDGRPGHFFVEKCLFSALPGSIFKFAGCFYHQKTLPGYNFGLIPKNKMAATVISFVIVSFLHILGFFFLVEGLFYSYLIC